MAAFLDANQELMQRLTSLSLIGTVTGPDTRPALAAVLARTPQLGRLRLQSWRLPVGLSVQPALVALDLAQCSVDVLPRLPAIRRLRIVSCYLISDALLPLAGTPLEELQLVSVVYHLSAKEWAALASCKLLDCLSIPQDILAALCGPGSAQMPSCDSITKLAVTQAVAAPAEAWSDAVELLAELLPRVTSLQVHAPCDLRGACRDAVMLPLGAAADVGLLRMLRLPELHALRLPHA
jgi:hypothetical protein